MDALPLLRFLLIFLISYVVLTYCYEYIYLAHYYSLDPIGTDPITQLTADSIAVFLNLFNVDTTILNNEEYFAVDVCINNAPQILLVHHCSAIHNQILLSSIIFSFPSQLIKAIKFIPLAIIFFFVFNVARNSSLALFHFILPEYYGTFKPIAALSIHVGFVFVLISWLYYSSKK